MPSSGPRRTPSRLSLSISSKLTKESQAGSSKSWSFPGNVGNNNIPAVTLLTSRLLCRIMAYDAICPRPGEDDGMLISLLRTNKEIQVPRYLGISTISTLLTISTLSTISIISAPDLFPAHGPAAA